MSFAVMCPHCRRGFQAAQALAPGETLSCPGCQGKFVTPPVAEQQRLFQQSQAPVATRPPAPAMAPPPISTPTPLNDPLNDPLADPLAGPMQHAASQTLITTRRPQALHPGLMVGIGGGAMAAVLAIVLLVMGGGNSDDGQSSGTSAVEAGVGVTSTISSGGAAGVVNNAVQQLPALESSVSEWSYRFQAGVEYRYGYWVEASVNGIKARSGGTVIYSPDTDMDVRGESFEGSGTAFVVHSDGLLMTCEHVVEGATRATVRLGEQTYSADVVATDSQHDLALLRIAASGLPVVPLSNEPVQLAEEVRAVGFPLTGVLGESVKVTRGSIAGIIREQEGLLQVDASINPGNSGGPLVNDRGEVMGVISAGMAGEHVSAIGFAVPCEHAMALLRSVGIDPNGKSAGRKLDGPEVARQVTPAVAYVKVEARAPSLLKLPFTARGSTMAFQTAGGIHSFRTIDISVRDRGNVFVERTGDVAECEGDEVVPFLMDPLGQMIFEALPTQATKRWERRRVVSAMYLDPGDGAIDPRGIRRRFSESSLPRIVLLPAVEHIQYIVSENRNDRITIQKHYKFTIQQARDGVLREMTGTGSFVFNTKTGVPESMMFEGFSEYLVAGETFTLPFSVKYNLVGAKTPQEWSSYDPAKVAEQKNDSRAMKAIEYLRAGNYTMLDLSSNLGRLHSCKVIDDLRDEVVRLLEPIIDDESVATGSRQRAEAILIDWATPACIPRFKTMLTDFNKLVVHNGMRGLANVGTVEAAEVLAACLADRASYQTAGSHLAQMGAVAEEAVIPYLKHDEERVASTAVECLTRVGTKKCLPHLQALMAKRPSLSTSIANAYRMINSRGN
ncbi:MAG: trypsin-like peptidase domain-containing protein [Planctomycetales bacterium]|nr:trypsin-like peptidase domain-containing protein [Planctomycetales bacterium]